MILDPVTWSDIAVFLLFLVPQLLFHRPLRQLIAVVSITVPFLLFDLPIQLIRDRHVVPFERRPPFTQSATLFQDLVIRTTRFAFARLPASVGAIFLSKQVAHPFMRFRMLRNGIVTCPISYNEIDLAGCRGVWMVHDASSKPDVVIYYCHGGGFSMGSAYFYLEYLLAWLSLLKEEWENPAIFALEYSLVPDAIFPTQVQQTLAGYEFCIKQTRDANSDRICVAGDSAGATLVLSLLLILGGREDYRRRKPGFATLVSPWCNLVSELNQNTASDFLNADSLHLYARQYVGEIEADDVEHKSGGRHRRSVSVTDALASPGDCKSQDMWAKASPRRGYHFIYGAEEVFAPSTRLLSNRVRQAGSRVAVTEMPAAIHAWPVVALFLASSKDQRLLGLRKMVNHITKAMR